ncbi:MAG: hypothetical protein WBQ71_16910 [Trebonia sp.]
MIWVPVAVVSLVGGIVVSYVFQAVRKRRTIRRRFWGLWYAFIHARYQEAVRDELVYAQARLLNYTLTDMAGKNASFVMPDPETDVPLYGEADGE